MQNTMAGDSSRWKHWNFPALSYTLLPIILSVRYINSPPDTRTYGPSHWFLNYHNGFVRRALVGQAFAHIAFLSWRKIFLIEALVLLCAIALTYSIFRPMLFGSLDTRKFAAVLLAAPAFLPHMSYMAGEMDNFLYLALIAAAWLLMSFRNNFGLASATILIFVGLAIHEGFLLMFYPLILVLLIDLLHRQRLKPLWVGLHCTGVAAFFAAILVFGKFRDLQTEWLAQAQQRTDMPIESTVVMALHNTLAEQVHFVKGRYTHLLLKGIFTTMLLCIPYVILLWRTVASTVRARGYSRIVERITLALFFVPLLLLPLGHDAMRWIAALCINISLYILFMYQTDIRTPELAEGTRLALARWNADPANLATFVYLLALGPWGLAGNRIFSNVSSLFKG